MKLRHSSMKRQAAPLIGSSVSPRTYQALQPPNPQTASCSDSATARFPGCCPICNARGRTVLLTLDFDAKHHGTVLSGCSG